MLRHLLHTVLLLSLLVLVTAARAEPAPPEPASANTPAAADATMEMEIAIAQLTPPVDPAVVDHLRSEMAALADPTEQQRLQQALDDQLQKIANWIGPDAPDAVITQHLDRLNLSDQASPEDLEARDEALSAIERIEDPARRDRLIEHLRERERDAGTLITAPTSSR